MGDVVIQTSLFAWIKSIFPDSKITLVTSKEFAPLVESHGFIDNVVAYEKKRESKILKVFFSCLVNLKVTS